MALSAESAAALSRLESADKKTPGKYFQYARKTNLVDLVHPGLDGGTMELATGDFNALVRGGYLQILSKTTFRLTHKASGT